MKHTLIRIPLATALLTAVSLAPEASGQCIPPEVKKLPAPAGYASGVACSLELDTLLVGLPLAASTGPAQGEVWVYERDLGGPGHWGRLLGLLASDGTLTDFFGASVDLDQGTALVGAPLDDDQGLASGTAYFFERDWGGPNAWGQRQKILGSAVTAGDTFGSSVALFGDAAFVGCPGGDGAALDSGTVYVFRKALSVWSQAAILAPADGVTGDRFGLSVGVYKDYAVVGAPDQDSLGAEAGKAFVYERVGGVWIGMVKLTASDGASLDRFGTSVAISGDTVLIGAPGHADEGPSSGSAYVFRRDQGGAGNWGEVTKLTASNAANFHGFGQSVTLDGDVAVIGALGVAPGGAAYLFHRNEGGSASWGELGMLAPSPLPSGARFGSSLALDGTTVAVGAPSGDATYVFEGPIALSPEVYCKAGTSASGCRATISTLGTPSATAASGFSLVAQLLEGNKDGLFFFGTNGRQANPWGNGTSYQCVVPPVKRAGLLTGTGTSGACDGQFLQDLNARWCPTCPRPGHNPGAGAVTQAQLWYRDPFNTSNRTTSLSNAVEFTVCP